nr:hypothetical protein [Tanacetum cinerariifolium]
MALPPRDQRHQYLRYEGLQYTDADITNFKMRLARIYKRDVKMGRIRDPRFVYNCRAIRHMALPPRDQIHQYLRVHVFDFGGLPDLMTKGLSARMLMEHRDAQGLSLFTSRAWRRLFDIRGPLDSILRLCHRLIACSISGRSQAPEKVTFVARLAEHFGLMTVKIYVEIDDTWVWVAWGPKRQPDAAAGALGAIEDAVVADEGAQAISVPVQATQPPPPPPVAARTMPQRMARLEDDVRKIRRALTEQREVIDTMARDFSRFSTWVITSLAHMMDRASVTYTSYFETPRES